MAASLPAHLETALSAFAERQPQHGGREGALAFIVESWLSENGFLPTGQEGLRPEELDATNDD
ncbi:hypothetical protein SAMN05880582_102171 [Rhizobium sp. RU20A]|uniref:hypothetical protein n=1 Tax=Rhizobium sp. RU20A TaxID=1907412 RepID=UPI000955A040|nr:hypothetical protein [Rhizobium sp. RU20A]SIQ57159.1 hypothetical protein SAMN05880582_102171 [Rhizobium sp. RU20A]